MTFIINIIIHNNIVGVSNFLSQLYLGSLTIPQVDFFAYLSVFLMQNSMYIIGALLVTKWASFEKWELGMSWKPIWEAWKEGVYKFYHRIEWDIFMRVLTFTSKN
jgi:hypothetical protein